MEKIYLIEKKDVGRYGEKSTVKVDHLSEVKTCVLGNMSDPEVKILNIFEVDLYKMEVHKMKVKLTGFEMEIVPFVEEVQETQRG